MTRPGQPPWPRPATVTRPSARVIVVCTAGDVLLFRLWENRTATARSIWITPGGGVHPGETVAAAAARELAEETGIRATERELGPVVAETRGQWSDGVTTYDARDTFFLLRVADTRVVTDQHEELEAALYQGHRWWPPGELTATTETVFPRGLGTLVQRLLSGERGPGPADLAWS